MIVVASALPAMLGQCYECEGCVEHCGKKCAQKVFGGTAGTAVEDYTKCVAGVYADKAAMTAAEMKCKAQVPDYARAKQYLRCRDSCDETFPDFAPPSTKCCYETATYACGEIFSMGFEVDDAESEVMSECFKLAHLFAKCPPAGGGLFIYNLTTRHAQVHMDPSHSPPKPVAKFDPKEEVETCIAEPTNVATGCWNHFGTESHEKLTSALDDPHSAESLRMFQLLAYWAKFSARQGRANAGSMYLARLGALAVEYGRYNIGEQQGFDDAMDQTFQQLRKELRPKEETAPHDEL